jgi:pyruvate kinase
MLADRRTKIVATIGPATEAEGHLEQALVAGMNVARLNFSHGDHERHLRVIKALRALSVKHSSPIAILQDLQGPKIRVGKFHGGAVKLEVGAEVSLISDAVSGQADLIPVDLPQIERICRPGMKVLMDDGLIELRVLAVDGRGVRCQVVFGGELKDRKGLNIPEGHLPVDALTPKDLDDLEFGLLQRVDYVALSFVRGAEDIIRLKELIRERGSSAKVIAKIEMHGAIANLEAIVRVSDGVMVARGDLAVEVGQAQLPLLQKRIITTCNQHGKPVITATQMLDSMIHNPRPTRAEITDVANAVLDGSDALMLSAESASGAYPFKAIQTMHEIILEVERNAPNFYRYNVGEVVEDIPDTIAAGACYSAQKTDAVAIVCLTTTGRTAARIASLRPKARVIAITHVMETLNRLELIWGIQTFAIKDYRTTDDAMAQIEEILLQFGLVKAGDRVVLTLGLPVQARAKTNSLRLYEIAGKRKPLERAQLPLRYKP